jgi:hypothetical protein
MITNCAAAVLWGQNDGDRGVVETLPVATLCSGSAGSRIRTHDGGVGTEDVMAKVHRAVQSMGPKADAGRSVQGQVRVL